MNGIFLINANIPKNIINNDNNTLRKGNIIQAKILNIFQNEILLQIGNEKILAKTESLFPQLSIGDNLKLLIADISSDKIILSLKTGFENNGDSALNLLDEFNLEDTEENKLILNRLITEKIKLSKDIFKKANASLQILPVEVEKGLDLLTNPNLITAIFNFFYNPEENFSISLFKEENKDNEAVYDINILYSSENLGHVLSHIKWSNNLMIEINCSKAQTVQLIEKEKDELFSRLKSFSELKFEVRYEKDLLEKVNSIKDNYETIKYKGIDLRI